MSRLFLSKLRMETPGQVAEGSRIVDEEQFGPVLPIIRYQP
jgi:hypothetical protein